MAISLATVHLNGTLQFKSWEKKANMFNSSLIPGNNRQELFSLGPKWAKISLFPTEQHYLWLQAVAYDTTSYLDSLKYLHTKQKFIRLHGIFQMFLITSCCI